LQSESKDPFADIRPFVDAEVPAVIARLVQNPELIDALARLRVPRLYDTWAFLARWLVRRGLRQRVSRLQTIRDVQLLVKPNLEQAIKTSSAGFSVSGLEHVDPRQSYVFVSNHRDIAMDPALANYALHEAGHRTLSIAIGDNLLTKEWVADLMRLNKSFIVRRNISAPRELMAASRHLAQFIRRTIAANEGPIWIAQREGRAKDGLDATEPAVVKMLSLSRDRQHESVADVLGQLQIVPISVAYELDPCDARKAAELAAGPGYQKQEFEDVASIAAGITGFKGRIHLHFGHVIPGGDVDTVVASLDTQILNGYTLYPTNIWAWHALERGSLPDELPIAEGSVSKSAFQARIDAMPAAHQPYALAMYANPVKQWLAAQQSE
jgi:hypothetical protein